MTDSILLDPLVPLPILYGLIALSALILAFAAWRRLSGVALRGLTAMVVLAALANPSWQQEDRAALSDIVLVVVDESASQRISAREAQTQTALEGLLAEIADLPNTEAQVVRVGDDAADGGTLAMARLAEALADIPRARLAGTFLISDGHVHDVASAPDLPAPLHLLSTGTPQDWDRRLIIKTAPAFAIMGEHVSVVLHVEDQGAVPSDVPNVAELTIRTGAEPPETFTIPVGQDLELPLQLPHGGINVLQLSLAAHEGELTDRNNAAVLRINGVRDRLRVLLVSGEPHAGERVWRNLLKSDASVDLVHFTILRPPEKQDGVPVDELSLIAFPTRELFVDKIDEFDLIIFDRYRRRGIMPMSYLENVRDYVRKGGALLISAGPEFGTADSLWRSPLAEVLPVEPSSRVVAQGFRPKLTELGQRHPVTAGLDEAYGEAGWGRWFRQMDMKATGGQIVMEGIDQRPLLVLDRVGKGRVGMLGSDQIWLWGRGYEGGGPQLELLRRLAHWTMKEPELEEETLTAEAQGLRMVISRRTLGESVGPVTIKSPDGSSTTLTLTETQPGLWQGEWTAADMGLYELTEGTQAIVVALGPAAPREFEQTIASALPMEPVLKATGGGAQALSEGMPSIRRVAEGRVAAGRGWLGITPREAFVTEDLRIRPLVPAWLLLLLAAGLALGAWLYEGRRKSA